MDDSFYKRPNTYTVIPRVLAFIEKDDEVLMIERSKKDAFAYKKLNGIGGHIERGEDPLTAIRREVNEESGLAIHDFDLRAVIFIDIEQEKGICVFVFSSMYAGGKLHPSSEGKLLWIKKDDLPNQPIIKDIPLILDLIEESKRDGKVKYVQHTYVAEELTITRVD